MFDTFIEAAANVVSAVVDAILPVQSASAAEIPDNTFSTSGGDLDLPSLDEVRTIEANTQQAQVELSLPDVPSSEAIVPPDVGAEVAVIAAGVEGGLSPSDIIENTALLASGSMIALGAAALAAVVIGGAAVATGTVALPVIATTAVAGAAIGAIANGTFEVLGQLDETGSISDWSAIGRSAAVGAVTGGLVGVVAPALLAIEAPVIVTMGLSTILGGLTGAGTGLTFDAYDCATKGECAPDSGINNGISQATSGFFGSGYGELLPSSIPNSISNVISEYLGNWAASYIPKIP